MLQESSAEVEETSPSAQSSLDQQAPQDTNPDSPRGLAMRESNPNPARVPARSSMKGGGSTLRRKPQMDPISESSMSSQQDSIANEEDLLQVRLGTMHSHVWCHHGISTL